MFQAGDVVKHRQTKRRTWTVVYVNKKAGMLILQRQGYKGRLITRRAWRPESYRKVDPADYLPHQYVAPGGLL